MLRSPYEWDAFAGKVMQVSLERKLHIPKMCCSSVTDVGVVISVTA